MTDSNHLNLTSNYFGKKVKTQAQRLAKRSLKIITSGVGMSPTNEFRVLFHDAVKLKNMLADGTIHQPISPQHLMIINDIFLDVAFNMGPPDININDLFDDISEAQNIINHALGMVNIRSTFDMSDSSLAAKLLFNQVSKYSKWIVFDLLSYCWNFGKIRCRKSLVTLLGSALRHGNSDKDIEEYFGVAAATAMFDAASRLTSEGCKSKKLKSKFPLIAYRGGYGYSPTEVANGMIWFLDIKAAVNKANVKPETGRQFYLLETLVLDDEVIMQLNNKGELMIKVDTNRHFETVELKPDWLPSVNKEGAEV